MLRKLALYAAVCLMVCACKLALADSITTLFDGGNGLTADGSAVMFDVTVGANDITVTGFDTNTDAANFSMNVYAVVGGYAGNEQNLAFWSGPVATGTGSSAGANVPSFVTLSNTITLSANTTYAFALEMVSGDHNYTNGDGTNEFYSNADVSISLGSAASTFATGGGSVFTPRIWNGTMYYDSAVIPEPTSAALLGVISLGMLIRRKR